MAKHALLSASGAHRWLECTPSALLELQFPQTTSEYAEEGTAAHELCELTARYFLGEAALTRGDAARVREMWGPLIAALDPADPRRVDLERRLPGAAR